MKNKLIFLIVVLVIFLGLIFFIRINKNAREVEREKVQIAEKMASDRQKFVEDSLQNNRIVNSTPNSVVKVASGNSKVENKMPKPSEEISSYINTSIKNTSEKTNISVTIVDENGNISAPLSSSIANIYNQKGYSGNTGLLRSSFLRKSDFQELNEGNSEIIEKLKLNDHADVLAIGKVAYSIRKGTLADATFVCTATLNMNIISTVQKSVANSFACSANGNGVTEEQAQEAATDKIVNKYFTDYSSL